MPRVTEADLDVAQAKPRKNGKLPPAPGRDEPLSLLRQWLSDASGLPAEVRIETVIRSGQEPEDPITLVLSNRTLMRCPHQSRMQSAKTLQAFLASASDGIALPHYLSPAEVGDYYSALCRMSAATSKADPVGDLRERLATYVALCQPLYGALDIEGRFATIEACRSRPVFDRAAAEKRSDALPVRVVDGDRQNWIRASEWVCWLRFAQGRTVDESGLVARMAELGSERSDPQAWNSDRSRKVHLVFYSIPEDL